jgi:putative tryptophan/tyrosine transport system substrate-binding protein
MKRREFITLISGAVAAPSLLWPLAARGQARRMPVVGYLTSRGPDDGAPLAAAFRRGLRDADFIEGQNIRIEYRWGRGQFDSLKTMAEELTRMPVAVLAATGGEPAVLAAKAATSTIPIVFAMSADPVRLGLATSYNRPGRNATGMSILTTTLEPRRLRLLRELLPGAAAIGVLVNPNFPPANDQVRDVEDAAGALGVAVRVFRANDERDIDAAFDEMARPRIDALAVAGAPFFDTQRTRIVELAARHSIPAMYHFREYPAAGGLMSYGIDIVDVHRQIGLYVGQILKGAKPAELPIMLPGKFEFVINLKAAKALGVKTSDNLLSLADEVIE